MRPYAGTNFLVSLYLDVGSFDVARKQVVEAFARQSDALPVTSLLWVEITNAFELHVHLARHGGQWRVSPETAGAAIAAFDEHVREAGMFFTCDVSWSELRREFRALSQRHTAKHGFRTYDILHVAHARLLGCDEFWSFDGKARMLAELEGMTLNRLL
jgi:predicted nucleic acid-binding protein